MFLEEPGNSGVIHAGFDRFIATAEAHTADTQSRR
jgi:hypothetical protein